MNSPEERLTGLSGRGATVLKGVFLLAAVAVGVMTGVGVVMNEASGNTQALIYTPRHLLHEAMIGLVGVFLIVEATNHIRADPVRGFRRHWNRYARILVGISILTVHAVVLLHGGYGL